MAKNSENRLNFPAYFQIVEFTSEGTAKSRIYKLYTAQKERSGITMDREQPEATAIVILNKDGKLFNEGTGLKGVAAYYKAVDPMLTKEISPFFWTVEEFNTEVEALDLMREEKEEQPTTTAEEQQAEANTLSPEFQNILNQVSNMAKAEVKPETKATPTEETPVKEEEEASPEITKEYLLELFDQLPNSSNKNFIKPMFNKFLSDINENKDKIGSILKNLGGNNPFQSKSSEKQTEKSTVEKQEEPTKGSKSLRELAMQRVLESNPSPEKLQWAEGMFKKADTIGLEKVNMMLSATGYKKISPDEVKQSKSSEKQTEKTPIQKQEEPTKGSKSLRELAMERVLESNPSPEKLQWAEDTFKKADTMGLNLVNQVLSVSGYKKISPDEVKQSKTSEKIAEQAPVKEKEEEALTDKQKKAREELRKLQVRPLLKPNFGDESKSSEKQTVGTSNRLTLRVTPHDKDQSWSFKEVKELRQSGKLDEALQMASQALELEPENIWAKRAAAWVYYDYLKKSVQSNAYESFKENLIKVKDLQLPEDEKMVFDNCAWQIGSMVFGLQKAQHVDYGKINELFEIIRDFHFTRPSEAYSLLYQAFHKGYQNWSNYLTFADWWNFDNLRSEDYLREEYGGKKVMSIAEQAYIAYSKKLLEGELLDTFGQKRVVDKENIEMFLPKLDVIIEKHPDYQYPPYFKAKLLLALGNDENVLSAFLPFAKQKRNVFWVWELMAEIFSEDKEIQFACYCKALSLKTSEDFLVKLRQTFAEVLIEKSMYNEAKTEIQKVIATREQHEWSLPNKIVQWIEQEWYKSATAQKDNLDLYSNHLKQAEEILFKDIPEEVIAVEFVNENRRILNFVKDKQKHGFFNYSGILTKPRVGDLLKVRFNGDGQDGFYKILTGKKIDSNTRSGAIKNFEGTLKVISQQNFGFVEDVFIDPKRIEEKRLSHGETLSGRAILSFNKKKNEWGWKAIEIK